MSPCLKTTLLDTCIFFWPGSFTISVTVDLYSSLIMQYYRNMFDSNKCDGLKRLKLNLRLTEGCQRWLWRILRLLVSVRMTVVVVQLLSHVWLFATPWIAAHWFLCPPLSPRVFSNSCPLSRWMYLIISSSPAPFSSCPQSFPASRSFPMSCLFAWGGKVLELQRNSSSVSIQGWFPLGLTALISLQPKGILRVFSRTTIQKHQFFGDQPYFHNCTWLLSAKWCLCFLIYHLGFS